MCCHSTLATVVATPCLLLVSLLGQTADKINLRKARLALVDSLTAQSASGGGETQLQHSASTRWMQRETHADVCPILPGDSYRIPILKYLQRFDLSYLLVLARSSPLANGAPQWHRPCPPYLSFPLVLSTGPFLQQFLFWIELLEKESIPSPL